MTVGGITKPSPRAGWHYEIVVLFGGGGRIVLTDGMSVDDSW